MSCFSGEKFTRQIRNIGYYESITIKDDQVSLIWAICLNSLSFLVYSYYFISEINAEEAELSASKQKYEMHHLSPPLISTLEKEIKEIQSSILSEHDLIECWTSRLHVLQDLYLEIKPVDPKEKRGSFNSSIFKIGFVDLHSYFERTGDSLIDKKKPVRRAKHNNHHHAAGSSNHQDKNGKHNYHDNNEDGTEGMKLSEILRFIRGNEDLIRIFECVEGKESNLVNDSSKHTPHHAQPSFQNMVAWVTVEVIRVLTWLFVSSFALTFTLVIL